MTNENEEKAREIAKNDDLYGDTDYKSAIDQCYISAIEMAKWKDEQELKFLQELCVHSNLGIVFEKMQNRIKELEATLNL